MKRRISLLLAVVMVLGSFSFAFAANDVDVPEFLKGEKIFVGDKDGDLMLNKNLTREEAVVLLARLLKVEDEAKEYKVTEELPSFTDTKKVDPYWKPFIAWAEANKYFKGHEGKREGEFGFGDNLTAKQYAIVLLRALGYEEAEDWEKVFAKAEELGLLKDVKASADDEIVRKVAAQMTFNALGTNLKGEKKTLAEKLGIKMPGPDELKAEKVYTENLSEVVVELSNAKLVDKEKLEDINNYKMTGFKIEKATVDGNNVILLLNDGLAKGKKYELVVRNIDKAINKTYKFTAEDNTIPAIENVEVLGEYGIKVTTSEPVKDPQERNFLIDGKNIAMDLEQYGRVLILTPYHNTAFPKDAKKLTIKPLADFAGFKSIEEDFEIEIVKDDVAPEVVDVVLKGNIVEVTFDKDIYGESVYGYYNRKTTGNVSYRDGRQTIYTVQYGGEKVDVNKARYEFDREIPRRSEITIEGVANHSDVAMKAVTTEGRIVTDYSEPALIDSKKSDYVRGKDGESGLTISLYFDKNVSGKLVDPSEKDDAKVRFVPEYHFDIYVNDVVRSRRLDKKIEDCIKTVKYGLDKDGRVRKDVIVLEITGLNVNNSNKDFDYVLEVRDFTDVTSFRNRMYRDYVDFNIPKQSPAFKVKSAKMTEGRLETEITISFNLPVDRIKAENLSNYLLITPKGAKVDIEDLDGKIVVDRSGYDVTLTLPEFNSSKYETLRVLETLKDVYYGNRLEGQRDFNLDDLKDGVNIKANEVIDKINKLPAVDNLTLENKDAVVAAREAYDDLKDSEKKYVSKDVLKKLTDAENKIKELEEKDKKGEKEKVAVKAINEANVYTMDSAISANAGTLGLDLTVYNTLKDKSPVYTALFGKNFADAKAVKTAFDAAVAAQKTAEEGAASEKVANQKAVDAAKVIIEGAKFEAVDYEENTEAKAKTAVENVIKGLTLGEGVNYKITGEFTAAGEDKAGSYVFTVKLTKGADTAEATATTKELTLVINSEKAANQKAVDAAKTKVEEAEFTANKTDVDDATKAKSAVGAVIDGLNLDVTYEITEVSFNAATEDANGSYVFTVKLTKGVDTAEATATTKELTLAINK